MCLLKYVPDIAPCFVCCDTVMPCCFDCIHSVAGYPCINHILAFSVFAQSCILFILVLFCLFVNRLLLSIDRRQSVEEAMDTVHLAVEYSSHVSSEHYTRVVGIDLSGDPKVRVVCVLNG